MINYTEKQLAGAKLLNNRSKLFVMFDGGARAGKTYLVCSYMIQRCFIYPGSKHLAARFRFRHARESIWEQTLIPMLRNEFPKDTYNLNRSTFSVDFANGSRIMIAGLDDSDRVEKIMGTEYATIFINEASQTSYDTFQMVKSRLNAVDIPLKFIIDTNPRSPSHWLHRVFLEKRVPITMAELPKSELYARLFWSPDDNRENLSEEYIENNLDTLTGIKKRRLREGIWCDSGEGTVYRFDRLHNHVDKYLQYESSLETWCSFDFGVSDPTAIIWYQILHTDKTEKNPKGLEIRIIDEYQNNNKPVDHYADIVLSKNYRDVQYCGDPSGSARSMSLDSWISKLRQRGVHVQTPRPHTIVEYVDNANDYIDCIRINEAYTPKTVEMFENWNYKRDGEDNIVPDAKPIHDIYSHLGTSFYYFMAVRFPMKKSGHFEIM